MLLPISSPNLLVAAVAIAATTAFSVAPVLPPSDPGCVYALLDEVKLLPDAKAPTQIELRGAFAIAEGERGQYYRAPQRGVLHFVLGKDADGTRAQWLDLQKQAGTGKVVVFGSRHETFGQGGPGVPALVAADVTVADPKAFTTGWGVQVVDNVRYGPVRELLLLPRCDRVTLDDERMHPSRPERPVVFTATNAIASEDGMMYVFTVATSDGERFASSAIAPGKGITTWTPHLALQVGEELTWTVQVLGRGIERAPIDVGTFVVPAKAVGERK